MAYYVFDDAKNLFEGMTKEQIVNAIANATGLTPEQIDADAVTTAIKEQNAQKSVSLWVGTQNEYNAIQQPDEDTLYIVTDPQEIDDLQRQIDDLSREIYTMKTNAQLWEGFCENGFDIETNVPITNYNLLSIDIGEDTESNESATPVLCAKTEDENGIRYTGSVYERYKDVLISFTGIIMDNDGLEMRTFSYIIKNPFSGSSTEVEGVVYKLRGLCGV